MPKKSNEATKLRHGKVIGLPSGYGVIEDLETKNEYALLAGDMERLLDSDEVSFSLMGHRIRGKQVAKIHALVERRRKKIMARFMNGSPPQKNSKTQKAKKGNKKSSKSHQAQIPHPAHSDYAMPCSMRIAKRINIIDDGKNHIAQKIPNNSIVEVALAKDSLGFSSKLNGRLIRVLGREHNADYEIDLSINEYCLSTSWSKEVIKELDELPAKLKKERSRRDLTKLPFVTIDGEDAQDYDDAIYCQANKRGWKLWVAIADVSHYVKPGSQIDQEAASRTSSVYFPGRVLPMLPEELSNDLCSLVPKLNRFVLVCEMGISQQGKLETYDFYKAVINSHNRLIYEEVGGLVESSAKELQQKRGRGVKEAHKEDAKEDSKPAAKKLNISREVRSSLDALHSLTKLMLAVRKKRQALDFSNLSEISFELDDNKKVTALKEQTRNIAHLMIEEAMLLANQAAAFFIAKHKLPFCYRVNEPPAPDALSDLSVSLRPHNINVPEDSVRPADYARILAEIHKIDDAPYLEMLVLRSLQPAYYSPINQGHFGLNYQAYSHFTSPIRRYADLMNHRAIKYILQGNKKQNYPYNSKEVMAIASLCSRTERIINKSVWRVSDALKCHYINSIGVREYDGTIVALMHKGFFVRLGEMPIEAMVPVKSIKDDYYRYDVSRRVIRGIRSARKFSIGDKVRVRLDRISLDERRMDASLCD